MTYKWNYSSSGFVMSWIGFKLFFSVSIWYIRWYDTCKLFYGVLYGKNEHKKASDWDLGKSSLPPSVSVSTYGETLTEFILRCVIWNTCEFYCTIKQLIGLFFFHVTDFKKFQHSILHAYNGGSIGTQRLTNRRTESFGWIYNTSGRFIIDHRV